MSAPKMHADEADIDSALVRRLLAAQFPQWSGLPVTRFPSSGTVNAVYRLGDELAVRLPRIASGVDGVAVEQRWLPSLAPQLPVGIPDVLGKGVPGEGYPWLWSVCTWLDGGNPDPDDLSDPVQLAKDLAEFIVALQRIDPAEGPPAYRGGRLGEVDAETRAAIAELDELNMIDAQAATAAWEESLHAPAWTGPPVWLHSDLMPGNLLTADGRLTGVIDFGTLGIGDPAADLLPAWNLLPPQARTAFRDALAPDDATWLRGRGWALSMSLVMLPYYRDTNPAMADNARHVIAQVLPD
ncbi:aminoglycoside phosphotransferase family protein [Streptomyces sp. NBC_01465]|uniref:aminoglycoside phosphotransferase family protein n=1 Tax=Streptomyces sp. NBC_01465 TaxID=2903878 RepID=UPI002E3467BA|nr:aminoglycoside phosphotransferase family protein [Streptomyces sp. NBC_01465]